MDKLKAKVDFVDAVGRVVIMTETNEALILYPDQVTRKVDAGDEIEIVRDPGKRRATDWRMLLILLFFLCIPMTAKAQVSDAQAVQTIVGEASGQGFDGMTAVGEVIRRRGSVDGLYGYKAMFTRQEDVSTWKLAQKAWERSKTTDLTHGATLFENIYAFGFPKFWDRRKVVCVAQIGDAWFFTEDNS